MTNPHTAAPGIFCPLPAPISRKPMAPMTVVLDSCDDQREAGLLSSFDSATGTRSLVIGRFLGKHLFEGPVVGPQGEQVQQFAFT